MDHQTNRIGEKSSCCKMDHCLELRHWQLQVAMFIVRFSSTVSHHELSAQKTGWRISLVFFRGTHLSTVLPKQKAQELHLNARDTAVPFDDQISNTGAVFSMFSLNAENASVKAVEVSAVVDSLPRSNNFVASTAFRDQLKIVRGASSNLTRH